MPCRTQVRLEVGREASGCSYRITLLSEHLRFIEEPILCLVGEKHAVIQAMRGDVFGLTYLIRVTLNRISLMMRTLAFSALTRSELDLGN